MKHYKTTIEKCNELAQIINDTFITQYRIDNPNDNITQRYFTPQIISGYGYIMKDSYTEQFVNEADVIEVVELGGESTTDWHETDKDFQIFLTYQESVELTEEYPELAQYRKDNNILSHKEEEGVYFYVNYFKEGHRDVLEVYGRVNEKEETN